MTHPIAAVFWSLAAAGMIYAGIRKPRPQGAVWVVYGIVLSVCVFGVIGSW